MNQRKGTFLLFLLVFPALAFAQTTTRIDSFNIASSSMRYPHQEKKWDFRIAAGLSMVKPPADLLENAIQAPLVNIHMIFGLPYRFSLEGDLTTILVSNQLALGPRWGYAWRHFSFNAGYDLAFVYGQMKVGGFNNASVVWIHYPSLSLGYRLKNLALTLKGECVVVANISQRSGENEITRERNFFNGITTALYIEQRLWKDHVFVIGLKDNYEKFYWPTWMLFSTFNRYYHIPELYFSWIL